MRVSKLLSVRKSKSTIIRKIVGKLLLKKGLDLPYSVELGNNVSFPHNGLGTVIHNSTIIHDNVKIYQNVTLGRKDIWIEHKTIPGIEIMDDAIICAGAKVLAGDEKLTIGKGAIVAANAVLFNSIGENEIWGGIPARFLGYRKDIKKED